MANLSENHTQLLALDGMYRLLRQAFVSGSVGDQRVLAQTLHVQIDYCLDAAAVLLENRAAAQSPTDLSLFEGLEVAPVVALRDTTVEAIGR